MYTGEEMLQELTQSDKPMNLNRSTCFVDPRTSSNVLLVVVIIIIIHFY